MLIVADDTGTDWTAVAEVIVGWSCTNEECDHHECKFLRAAAVGLRRLAQLDTAIGDPGNLRLLADTFDLPILRRIADAAVLGSGERPEGTEPRRPLPPVNPGQRMPGGPTPQP